MKTAQPFLEVDKRLEEAAAEMERAFGTRPIEDFARRVSGASGKRVALRLVFQIEVA